MRFDSLNCMRIMIYQRQPGISIKSNRVLCKCNAIVKIQLCINCPACPVLAQGSSSNNKGSLWAIFFKGRIKSYLQERVLTQHFQRRLFEFH